MKRGWWRLKRSEGSSQSGGREWGQKN